MAGGDNNSSNSFVSRFASKKNILKGQESFGNFTAKYSNKENNDKENRTLVDKKEKQPFVENKSVQRRIKRENHADAAKKSRIDCVFLVRGKDKGRSAWHYVLVDKSKKEMFLAKSRTGTIDVALYGQILYSGWGENPPEDIVKKIEDEFGA